MPPTPRCMVISERWNFWKNKFTSEIQWGLASHQDYKEGQGQATCGWAEAEYTGLYWNKPPSVHTWLQMLEKEKHPGKGLWLRKHLKIGLHIERHLEVWSSSHRGHSVVLYCTGWWAPVLAPTCPSPFLCFTFLSGASHHRHPPSCLFE